MADKWKMKKLGLLQKEQNKSFEDLSGENKEEIIQEVISECEKESELFEVRTFLIPVDGLSREEAEKHILELMSEYHEDVKWDESTGEIKIDETVKKPRGWHLRAEYIDSDGKVYNYGKLVE